MFPKWAEGEDIWRGAEREGELRAEVVRVWKGPYWPEGLGAFWGASVFRLDSC